MPKQIEVHTETDRKIIEKETTRNEIMEKEFELFIKSNSLKHISIHRSVPYYVSEEFIYPELSMGILNAWRSGMSINGILEYARNKYRTDTLKEPPFILHDIYILLYRKIKEGKIKDRKTKGNEKAALLNAEQYKTFYSLWVKKIHNISIVKIMNEKYNLSSSPHQWSRLFGQLENRWKKEKVITFTDRMRSMAVTKLLELGKPVISKFQPCFQISLSDIPEELLYVCFCDSELSTILETGFGIRREDFIGEHAIRFFESYLDKNKQNEEIMKQEENADDNNIGSIRKDG